MGFKNILKEIDIVGFDILTPALLTAFLSDVPVLLSGPPGTAKTTIVKRLAVSMKQKALIMDVPHLSVEILLGIPNPWAMEKSNALEFVGGLFSEQPDIIVLDELTRGNPLIQGYLIELVRERRLLNKYLQCPIWATGNPPSMAMQNVNYLDLAFATRFAVFEIDKPSIEDMMLITEEMRHDKQSYDLSIDLYPLYGRPPDAESWIRDLAKSIVRQLYRYDLNPRQISHLLTLLSKALEIERAGVYRFTNFDVAYLAASLFPFKLVRSHLLQDNSFHNVASDLSKSLSDYPFDKNSSISSVPNSLPGELEALSKEISSSSISELLKFLEKDGSQAAMAFGEILSRLHKDYPNEINNLPYTSGWRDGVISIARSTIS